MQITTTAGSGRYTVKIVLNTTDGNGINAFLTGGTRPHVGGVAYAVPRPKSSGEGLTADISTICGPGHKDVYAASNVAERLCLLTGETVCVCAGLHVDAASKAEINQVMEDCISVAEKAVEIYKTNIEIK